MNSNLIRVADNRKYFCFGDGRPYVPIGHNTYSEVFTVYGYENTLYPTELLEERFARLAEHGGNFLRLFISANLQAGYFATGEMNPEEVARLDLVFALGEKYDLHFYVELLMSQYYTAWYHADQWLPSPYNADNGGPVRFAGFEGALPEHEVPGYMDQYLARIRMGYGLENETFVAAQKAKIRWFVERYGGNPRVMCWGLSNDFPLHEGTEDVLRPWLRCMSDYVREVDGHGHPVTLQMFSGSVWPDWILDCVDLTSIRAYPWSAAGVLDDSLPDEVLGRNPNNIAVWLNRKGLEHLEHGMPSICGEYGASSRRNDDPRGYRYELENRDLLRARGTLYGLWAPLCSGSSPGHRWTGYDGFYPLTGEEYGWLRAVRRFCDRINWTTFSPRSAARLVSAEPADCSVAAIADEKLLVGWLWDRLWIAKPRALSAALRFTSPPPGRAQVEWTNCHTGRVCHAENYERLPERIEVPGSLEECAAVVVRWEG